jgi:hypothetical protein
MEPNLRALIAIGQLLWIIVSLLIIESIIEEKIRRYRSDKFIDELESVTVEDLLNCEEVEEVEKKENIFKKIFNKIKNFFKFIHKKMKIFKKNLKKAIIEKLKDDE